MNTYKIFLHGVAGRCILIQAKSYMEAHAFFIEEYPEWIMEDIQKLEE